MIAMGSLDGKQKCHTCKKRIPQGEFGTSDGVRVWCGNCSDKNYGPSRILEEVAKGRPNANHR